MKLFTSKLTKRALAAIAVTAIPVAAFLKGDEISFAFNQLVNRNVPATHRNIIKYISQENVGGLISAAHILKTGEVPIYSRFSPSNALIGNKFIDWASSDTFTKTFANIENNVRTEILMSPELMALTGKILWDRNDDQKWDRAVSYIIGQQIQKTPGLHQFRTDDTKTYPSKDVQARLITRLNDLSQDIENDTKEKEFDCEGMSIVKACLLQKIADSLLLPQNRPKYFVAHGSIAQKNGIPGAHSFVVSQKMNFIISVIESTINNESLVAPVQTVRFDKFAAGEPILCTFGDVYGLGFNRARAEELRASAHPLSLIIPQKEKSRVPAASP